MKGLNYPLAVRFGLFSLTQFFKAMAKQVFNLNLKITVSQNWVDDGCNPHSKEWLESIAEAISELMPYAYEHEFVVDVKPAPKKKAGA